MFCCCCFFYISHYVLCPPRSVTKTLHAHAPPLAPLSNFTTYCSPPVKCFAHFSLSFIICSRGLVLIRLQATLPFTVEEKTLSFLVMHHHLKLIHLAGGGCLGNFFFITWLCIYHEACGSLIPNPSDRTLTCNLSSGQFFMTNSNLVLRCRELLETLKLLISCPGSKGRTRISLAKMSFFLFSDVAVRELPDVLFIFASTKRLRSQLVSSSSGFPYWYKMFHFVLWGGTLKPQPKWFRRHLLWAMSRFSQFYFCPFSFLGMNVFFYLLGGVFQSWVVWQGLSSK